MIADERHGDAEPRRAIDFIPGYSSNRYSDRIEEETEEDMASVVMSDEEDKDGKTKAKSKKRVRFVLPVTEE